MSWIFSRSICTWKGFSPVCVFFLLPPFLFGGRGRGGGGLTPLTPVDPRLRSTMLYCFTAKLTAVHFFIAICFPSHDGIFKSRYTKLHYYVMIIILFVFTGKPDHISVNAIFREGHTKQKKGHIYCYNALCRPTCSNDCQILCVVMPWTRGIFPVGDRGKMQWIIDNLLNFLIFFIFVGATPYPSPRCVHSWFSGKVMASQLWGPRIINVSMCYYYCLFVRH